MKQRLTIIVEKMTVEPGKRLKQFDKVVEIDSSISVPFSTLLDSLQFIYGYDCVISFQVSNY